jgi:phosphate transport system permease protein
MDTGATARRLRRARARRRTSGSAGDRLLFGLCAGAGLLTVAVLVEIAYQLISGAEPAISHFGTGFIFRSTWAPTFGRFGAWPMLYGTLVSSLLALLIATPIGIAIGLYLSMIAPPGVRTVVGPLVEMLAAIPSVILGFWGVIVFVPFLFSTIEPALHRVLGFVPLFAAPTAPGVGLFAAGVVLTLMVVPIIASISRDLFLTVPRELTDGAAALGSTRWEVIRGIVMPSTISGIAAATVLGLGRALGEAIAVLQVVGGSAVAHSSLFESGSTLASRIANDFQSPASKLHVPALFYLALILLVIGLFTSLMAQFIARRFDVQRAVAR